MSEQTPTIPPFPETPEPQRGQTPPPPVARPPAAPAPPSWCQPPPRRKGWLRRILRSAFLMLFVLSVILNGYLLLLVKVQMAGKLASTVVQEGADDQVVALYTISGMINDEAADNFAAFETSVCRDANVKIVVLRVDSPGGGVGASDRISAMVEALKARRKIKVIVSMGAYATSGGYYISAPADEIFAEPTTITGAIGVIANWIVIKGTLDKIGAEPVVFRSSGARGWKDEISPFRKPDSRQRKHLQELLDGLHARFRNVVTQGRGKRLKPRKSEYMLEVTDAKTGRQQMVPHSETEPFNGKVYLSGEAMELGMIDSIGYQSAAIVRAAKLASLDEPKVVHYQIRKWGLLGLLRGQSHPAVEFSPRKVLDELRSPRIELIWRP